MLLSLPANATTYSGGVTKIGQQESNKIIDLDNPPESIPVGEITYQAPTGKYICSVCGYIYDPAENDGVKFEDLPENWRCPRCKQGKEKFNKA